jgi:hypothetical protein
MKRTLREFSYDVRDADIAVVFYAGHGMEMNGVNYLIPVDATIASDVDVEDETITLDRVIQSGYQQFFQHPQQRVHRGGLAYERRIRARTLHRIEAAIADVGDAPRGQSRTKLRAVSVSECVIHDCPCQAIVLDQDERVANRGRCCHVSAGCFKRVSYVHASEHFVLHYEDRAPAQCGEFHGAAPMRG